MVVFSKNPIHSILYLIITIFTVAGHYILLNAEFLAFINMIVYAGAIMVLFLFVLMLLNLNEDSEPHKSYKFKLAGVTSGCLFMLCIIAIIHQGGFHASASAMDAASIPNDFGYAKPLGQLLFTDYVFPFEVSSILFIASMVGAVYLGKKD
jgi:NADH-quinone oxidoreductase subunit J